MIDRSFQRSKHIGPRLTARHGNERILLWPAFSEARLKAVRPFGHLIGGDDRSEEHTFELQSPFNLVCRLLLEKNKLPVINVRRLDLVTPPLFVRYVRRTC